MLRQRLLGHYDWSLKYLGIPLQFLGLAGIADGFFKWKDFFANFLIHYRGVRSLFFSWVPFVLSPTAQDYLVIGFGLAITIFRITVPFAKIAKSHPAAERRSSIAIFDVVFFLVLLLLWPLATMSIPYSFYLFRKSDKEIKSKVVIGESLTRRDRRERHRLYELRSASRKQVLVFTVNYLVLLVFSIIALFLVVDFSR